MAQQERDHMEHKLDELQQQSSRLGPSNLSKHDQVTELDHEILQLTAENEVGPTVIPEAIRVSYACSHAHAADRLAAFRENDAAWTMALLVVCGQKLFILLRDVSYACLVNVSSIASKLFQHQGFSI